MKMQVLCTTMEAVYDSSQPLRRGIVGIIEERFLEILKIVDFGAI